MRRSFGLIALMFRGNHAKDAELLALRHENAVLRRNAGRVRYEPAGRAWFAALTRFIPRHRWAGVFPVTPATLLAWHRELAARKYGTSKRRQPGRPAARTSPAPSTPSSRPSAPGSCTAVQAPRMNATCERLIGTLRCYGNWEVRCPICVPGAGRGHRATTVASPSRWPATLNAATPYHLGEIPSRKRCVWAA